MIKELKRQKPVAGGKGKGVAGSNDASILLPYPTQSVGSSKKTLTCIA
jgi:hypothetical protein